MNNTMTCLKLNREVCAELKYFGMLQCGLLEMKPSLIGIGLIKEKIGSQYQDLSLKKLKKNSQFKEIYKEYIKMELRENAGVSKEQVKQE